MKIYKIIDNTNGNVYIGKTTRNLKERLRKHKCDKGCSSREIIKNGDYRIELIEETDDDSRERYWIENTECVNKNIPGRTNQERYQDQREYRLDKQKKYYLKNKERLSEERKEYYQVNREKKLEYQKEYEQKNKEKIKKYQKQRHKYRISFGGDPRNDNNLLKIHPDLFIV